MDYTTKSVCSPPEESPQQQQTLLPQQPDPNKLVGARKRKPVTISKISSNSTSPQKSPLLYRDDEEENEAYFEGEERANRVEPNNNKIQTILSELKYAKQKNKQEEMGGNKEARARRDNGGGHRGSSASATLHHAGGMLVQEPGKAYLNGIGAATAALRLGQALTMSPHQMLIPAAHVQPKQAHSTSRATSAASNYLQDEPLDLSVDAVDLSKNHEQQNMALMMLVVGGRNQGNSNSHKRFPRKSLPSPPPSPPPNIPMDLTRSSTTSPRFISKPYQTDRVLMIGGKLSPHEFNDRVSSSFGSPPSSIDSNSDAGSTKKRKYQRRNKSDDVGVAAGRRNGGRKNSACSVGAKTVRKSVTPPGGVKPKQRRYRTERPFHCPHCPARFTLRSNMERHGKHQHPSIWQRSPSNRVLNKQRALQAQQAKSGVSPPPVQQLQTPRQADYVKDILNQQLKMKMNNPEGPDLASVESLLEKSGNEDFKKYFRIGGYVEDEDMDEQQGKGEDGAEDDARGDDEDRIDEYDDERFREDFYDEDEVVVHEQEMSDNRGKRNLRSRSRAAGAHAQGIPVQTKSLSAYSSAPHKISCPHCTRKFPWTSSLRRHLLTHTGQKPFQCSHCPLLFTTKSNCDRHVARKHSAEGGAVTITLSDVGSCNAILRGKLSEKVDQVTAGSEEDDDEDDDYDGMVSKMDGGKAGEGEDEDRNENKEKAAASSSNSSASFRCHLCELSSPVRSVILKHIETSHSDNYALLDVVGGVEEAAPPDEDSGNATNRKVLCAFCIRRFWSVEDLRRHMRSHTGERPFSCECCNRRFSLKHSLLRHMKKHESGSSGDPVDESKSK